MKDTLFKKPLSQVRKFAFDLPVVQAFDDMIKRSVPFYTDVLKMSAELLKYLLPNQATIYDMGCSTGNFASALLQQFNKESLRYVGVDNSPEMLKEARARYYQYENIIFEDSSLQECKLMNPDAVSLHYTLQFVDAKERTPTLTKIFEALGPGGVLILSEKFLPKNDVFRKSHLDFKKKQGYSNLEIAQKREALEEVLVPLSLEKNIHNLYQAGFKQIEVFFQWYNFASILAQK